MGNYSINKIDYNSSYPNKGGNIQLSEEGYKWVRSYMSSTYGMSNESIKELENKFKEIYGNNGGKNKWK